ncbi:MAG: hypothetical protein AABX72_04670 [Nanoarchaeota archaeon]
MISKREMNAAPVRARLEQLSKQQLLNLVEDLHRRSKISSADIEQTTADQGLLLPCSIFTKELTPLESICLYLKDVCTLSYHEIATLVNRDDRTIWTVYQHAHRKKKHFVVKKNDMMIPLRILKDRHLSVMEHIVRYLKNHSNLTYHQIAELLHRDDRTIWTVYQRGLKKVKS